MPATVLVTEAFAAGAQATARARGYDQLPILVFPADFDELPEAQQRDAYAGRVDELLAALSRP